MRFSVEVDNSNAEALVYCLNLLQRSISDFDYDWRITINAGGIDYGIYLNIDTEEKEIEISNQPDGDGDDYLDDVIEEVNKDID